MHATCKSARGNHETAFKVMPTFQWNYMDYLLALRVHRVGTYIDLKSSYSVSRKIFQEQSAAFTHCSCQAQNIQNFKTGSSEVFNIPYFRE